MKELPDKASELIRLSIKDLEACEQNPRYTVEMMEWHDDYEIDGEKKCHVCLAGAVMAQTCEIPPEDTATPYSFVKSFKDENFSTALKLDALDSFRRGHPRNGLNIINHVKSVKHLAAVPEIIKVAEYDKDPDRFKADMLAMADMLEAAGL